MAQDHPRSPIKHVSEGDVGCHPSCTRCALLRTIDRSLSAFLGRLPLLVEEDKAGAFESLVGIVRKTFDLRPRELEVFLLLMEGSSNSEISEKLGIATNTAQVYVQRVKKKVGVERAKIPMMALRLMRQHGVRKGSV